MAAQDGGTRVREHGAALCGAALESWTEAFRAFIVPETRECCGDASGETLRHKGDEGDGPGTLIGDMGGYEDKLYCTSSLLIRSPPTTTSPVRTLTFDLKEDIIKQA
ncbi:unnamed protein product [Pleuronectes platessa]|uniref:Uncharacterized protein n=1 Tax=Pleuronectes platessa TaxID=8262 RepID=A0A9N7UR18_PLEPL|nr:unnamed protein product [Pleuronectes platessa]